MPKRVSEQYDELMHYTTASGLAGIVESGCLRATNASYLNDASELTHFFDSRLEEVVSGPARRAAEQLSRQAELKAKIEKFGGADAVAKDAVKAVLASMRGTTMRFNRPYIFSMCFALEARVKNNGLLSQWRGYGRDGGYAIVFDPAGIEELLLMEEAEFHYQFLSLGDVFYYGEGPNQPAMEEVREAEAKIESVVERLVGQRGGPEIVGEMYVPVTMLSTLYKHWGFSEEQEVRVVAIPLHPEAVEVSKSQSSDKKQKVAQFLPKEGLLVPYIEMFRRNSGDRKLPIKRVIVGPHPDKEKRVASAKGLLEAQGYDVPVIASDIPYIGR